MTNKLGSKTPAQTHNDLFYINNGNSGIDTTLRSIYSGNGAPTAIKTSTTKCEIDFNKGLCTQPVLYNYHVKSVDIGLVPSTYQIKMIDGNLQKININGDTTLSIASSIDSGNGAEITLIVLQLADDKKLSFSGNVKTNTGNDINLSGTTNETDIIKLVTADAGTTWYAFTIAQGLQ